MQTILVALLYYSILNDDLRPVINSKSDERVGLKKTFSVLCLQTIEGARIVAEQKVSFPHTTHCLPDGTIMISTLGDKHSEARGF